MPSKAPSILEFSVYRLDPRPSSQRHLHFPGDLARVIHNDLAAQQIANQRWRCRRLPGLRRRGRGGSEHCRQLRPENGNRRNATRNRLRFSDDLLDACSPAGMRRRRQDVVPRSSFYSGSVPPRANASVPSCAPADGPAGMTDCGSRHAHTSNSCPTHAAA
jgi:hypothetical protein